MVAVKSETRIRLPNLDGEVQPPRGRAYLYPIVALAGIWVPVALLCIFAPDLVTGAFQDRFPLALVVAPLAGVAATRSVARAFSRLGQASGSVWVPYVVTTSIIWIGVALAGTYAPVMVTGTDPTRLPLAVLVAPIAGAMLQGATTEFFLAARR